MGTRAMIAAMTDDQTCQHLYCHIDGYVAGAGATLHNHYPTLETAMDLMRGGAVSILKSTPQDTAYSGQDALVPETLAGSVPEVMTQIEERLQHSDQEYAYLHDGTRWLVHTYGLWHNDERGERADTEVPRGGWRDLGEAVAALRWIAWSRRSDGTRDVSILEVGEDLSIAAWGTEDAYYFVVRDKTQGVEYTTAPAEIYEHALYAALCQIPAACLPAGLTPYDIGVYMGSDCGFLALMPPLSDLPGLPAEAEAAQPMAAGSGSY